MRPRQLSDDDLVVHADFAALFAPWLEEGLRRARRDGLVVDLDHIETIQRLTVMGDAYVNRQRVQPSVDETGCTSVEWVPVRRYAQIEGISRQAATKRCQRGHVAAVQDEAGHWHVAITQEVA